MHEFFAPALDIRITHGGAKKCYRQQNKEFRNAAKRRRRRSEDGRRISRISQINKNWISDCWYVFLPVLYKLRHRRLKETRIVAELFATRGKNVNMAFESRRRHLSNRRHRQGALFPRRTLSTLENQQTGFCPTAELLPSY